VRAFVAVFIVILGSTNIDVGASETPLIKDVGEKDRAEIQAAIGDQLAAFQARDAERAFSYASPAIQSKFRTPANFISMVRAYYPVVYAARNPEYLPLTAVRGIWIQGVIISDSRGEAWLAQYPMEKQSDGRWLINGCLISVLEDRNL
tara:strand:- start:61 stop:504 length:444 start_codon:yes stop_codon:yes gene_type:complete